MVVENILTAGQLAAAFTAFLVLGGFLIRWLVVPPLEKKIDEKTAQIQPNSNGGKSLPDIAIMVGRLSEQIRQLDDRLRSVESFIHRDKN
jgi:hypothetical protein